MTIGRFTTEEEIDLRHLHHPRERGPPARVEPAGEMYKDGIDISTIQWAAH